MIVVALVFATLAAALHVFIWYLESFAWTGRAMAVFGTTPEQAESTREMAFNQGFYNLFLAVIAVTGVTLSLTGQTAVGNALVVAGCGSMLAAALVLGLSSLDKRGAAVRQGVFPLVALAALVIGSFA